jgi:hypothetical protein
MERVDPCELQLVKGDACGGCQSLLVIVCGSAREMVRWAELQMSSHVMV